MWKKKSSNTRRRRTEKSTRLSWKPRGSRMRRKGKSRDSESSRRRLQTVKQKLTPSEPRELLRKASDRQESEKDLSTRNACA